MIEKSVQQVAVTAAKRRTRQIRQKENDREGQKILEK